MYRQWGLPLEAIDELDQRLAGFFRLYARTMRTRTRDGSGYGLAYLSGMLRMETGRTLVGISRASGGDGQGMQHFMSEGKWAGPDTIAGAHDEMALRPELQDDAKWLLGVSADQ